MPASGSAPYAVDDGFVPLRVKQVVRETADTVSLVFDQSGGFAYEAGQYLTLSVRIAGQEHRRCYSMSSSPRLGEDLRITVKRDRDGVVSNWINDTTTAGDLIPAAPPQGRFVLQDSGRDIVAFAGGSGITPVFSLLRCALATTSRTCRLLYANRSRDSIIFADALTELREKHGGRFDLTHHLDDERGVLTVDTVVSFAGETDADIYVCGPGPFMDIVETSLRSAGVPADRVKLERFTVTPSGTVDSVTEKVTIELDRTSVTIDYRAGNTLLQTARLAGLRAPASCETGSCGTCMAQVTEGSARMLNNDALDDDEVADGWVVTCQAMPTSRTVKVVYE